MAGLVRGRVRGGAVRPVRDGERDAGAAAATTRLEAVVSGLGTGYTALGEDDDPEGAAARDPFVRCPCVRVGKGKRGGLGGGAEREEKGARRCASRLLAPPFAEAERETHQIWAMAATEALFAARDSRMFASSPSLSDPPGGASIFRDGGSPSARGSPRGDPMDADATDPRRTDDAAEEETAARERFAICPNFSCAARVLLSRRRRCGMAARTWWLSATPPHRGGSRARRSYTGTPRGSGARVLDRLLRRLPRHAVPRRVPPVRCRRRRRRRAAVPVLRRATPRPRDALLPQRRYISARRRRGRLRARAAPD